MHGSYKAKAKTDMFKVLCKLPPDLSSNVPTPGPSKPETTRRSWFLPDNHRIQSQSPLLKENQPPGGTGSGQSEFAFQHHCRPHGHELSFPQSNPAIDLFIPEPEREDYSYNDVDGEQQLYERTTQRTILVRNLSDQTTHADIAEIVRGGAVIDIYLRLHNRCATFSFLESSAAQEFMKYTKRKDVYLHGKRVSTETSRMFSTNSFKASPPSTIRPTKL